MQSSGVVVFHLDPTDPIDTKPEEKKPAERPIQYPYLKKVDDYALTKILHKLPEKFHTLTRQKAEQLLATHDKKFKQQLYLDRLANASNLIFVLYLMNTGAEGFVSFITILSGKPREEIENNATITEIATFLIPFTSTISTLMWFSMTSPWTTALVSTLRHATEEAIPFKQKIFRALDFARQNPRLALRDGIIFPMLFVTTQIVNLTAASTDATPVVTLLNQTRPSIQWLKWLIVPFILYFSKRFCSHCFDENAANNLKQFWLNQGNHTSLIKQIANGRILVSIKTFLEGTSAIGLKWLFYFFNAALTEKAFGWYFNPIAVAVCGSLHGCLINYPTVFQNLIGPFEAFDTLLAAKMDSTIDQFFEEHLATILALNPQERIRRLLSIPFTAKNQLIALDIQSARHRELTTDIKLEKQFDKLLRPLIRAPFESKEEKAAFKKRVLKFNDHLIEEQIIKNEGRFNFVNQIKLETLNMISGSYAAVKLLSPTLNPYLTPYASIPLSALVGAATVGTFFYKGALDTQYKKAAYAEISGHPYHEQNTHVRKGILITSSALVLFSGFADYMTTITTSGNSISHIDSLMVLLVVAATQRWLNSMRYYQPLVQDTLDSALKSIPRCNAEKKDVSTPSTWNRLRFWKRGDKNDKTTHLRVDLPAAPIIATAPSASI